jgi:DNA repair photolyase
MLAAVPDRDTAEILAGLLSPAGFGDEVAPGVRLLRVSTELGLRLGLSVDGRPAHVHVAPVELSKRHAAASKHFAFSYRSGELSDQRGMEICRALAARAATNEATVLSELSEATATLDAPRIRRVRVSSLLEPAGDEDEPYLTLSPYVGCLIGCRFCYAQSHLAAWRALVGLPEAPWGSYVEVRENAPEVLRRELREVPVLPIKFCPVVSDPYHAVEKREALTQRLLEELREAKRRDVLVLTRSALVRRDLDLLADLGAHLGVSLPTADDAVRAHFEPRGARVEERLEILREARDKGIRTFAVVQPLLPGSVEALADALASAVSSARVDVLHGVEGAAGDFAHPEYAESRDEGWQKDRAARLVRALEARGVDIWSSELPPNDD